MTDCTRCPYQLRGACLANRHLDAWLGPEMCDQDWRNILIGWKIRRAKWRKKIVAIQRMYYAENGLPREDWRRVAERRGIIASVQENTCIPSRVVI